MKIQFKIIIVLLSISAVFAGSAEESECATPEPKKVCTGGPNDGWTNCGSACPLTCEKPVAGVCTKQCILNTCQCQNGTVRASDGQCIKASDCSWYEKKINCTENEKCTAKCTGGVYDKCTLCGTACPLTCDKPKVDVCTLQCKVNVCECQSGTVRDTKTGQCVKPDQCPPPKVNCTGGPYDEYTNCGSSCPLTCDKPKRVDVCLAVCVPNTCECKSPYIRDTKSGQCVKPDQCPPPKANCTGGPYDEYTDCGSLCPPTCDKPEGGICAAVCVPNTCKCKSPYIRDTKTGQCVKPDQCPPPKANCTGGPYDEYTDCGSRCPPTCDKPEGGICAAVCVPNTCKCKSPYIRDTKTGQCVKPDQCPPPKANCTGGPHDKYTNCGSSCPPTCDKPKGGICAAVCVENTCQCESPYIRDTKSGQCVKPDQCPPNNNGTDCPTKCTGGPHDKCVKDCGNMCPPTCANPSTSGKCQGMCRPNVCRCEDGWVRDLDGKCIKPDQCPSNTTTIEPCETSTTTKAPTDSGW